MTTVGQIEKKTQAGSRLCGERPLMDHHLPHWRQARELLNTTPLAHDFWNY